MAFQRSTAQLSSSNVATCPASAFRVSFLVRCNTTAPLCSASWQVRLHIRVACLSPQTQLSFSFSLLHPLVTSLDMSHASEISARATATPRCAGAPCNISTQSRNVQSRISHQNKWPHIDASTTLSSQFFDPSGNFCVHSVFRVVLALVLAFCFQHAR